MAMANKEAEEKKAQQAIRLLEQKRMVEMGLPI